MVLGQLGLDIGPAVAGLGVVGIAVGFGAQSLVRDYLNGALILIENQFAKGDVVRRRRRGHGRGLHPAADDAARPRRRRPHRPQRRDQGGLQPDPRLGADQPGRDRRLRHRHRQGDRGRRRGRPRDGRDPSGSGGSSRRRGSSGSRRSASTASRSRSSARSAPPSSGPPAASSASACSPRSRRTASRSRGRSGVVADPSTTADRPAPTSDDLAERPEHGADRRRPRRERTCRTDARRMAEPADIEHEGLRERRAVPAVARDREPPRREPDLPAGPGVHRAGQRDGRPLRRGRGATSRPSGPKLARERIDWSKPFDTTLEWDLPFAKWFIGGKLNIAYNCVDRHVERGLGDKVAYHWIGEPGDTRTHHLRATSSARSARPPTPSRSSASRPATGSRSTCR